MNDTIPGCPHCNILLVQLEQNDSRFLCSNDKCDVLTCDRDKKIYYTKGKYESVINTWEVMGDK